MNDAFERFVTSAKGIAEQLVAYRRRCLEGQEPTVRQLPIEELSEKLRFNHWIKNGGLTDQPLSDWMDTYLANSTRLHAPGFMAHQVAIPHPNGALANLVYGFDNNAMNIYEMGPAASAAEYAVINWMLSKIGWGSAPWPKDMPEDGAAPAGLLTSGGSLANLTALLAARARAFPDTWEQGNSAKAALLVPEGPHYSVARAAGIMGLGTDALITVAGDHRGVLDPKDLEPAYQRALDAGRRPFALVLACCATGTGLYDPIEPAAAFCAKHNLWLHIDGAHGAAALASVQTRHYLKGIEAADSVIWDAHKMLATPSLCAAVLVKHGRDLFGAMRQNASYLFHDKDQPGYDFIEHTVECTKTAMGLRLFLILGAMGEQGMGDHVAQLYAKTTRFAQQIQARPGFEIAVEPQANILCFRYKDHNALMLRKEILRKERYYLSTVDLMGKSWLRLVIMNHNTTTETIDGLLNQIEQIS